MKNDIHILMLEDDTADAALVQHALRQGGFKFSLARVEFESLPATKSRKT